MSSSPAPELVLVDVWWSTYRRSWLGECTVPSCGWTSADAAASSVYERAAAHEQHDHGPR